MKKFKKKVSNRFRSRVIRNGEFVDSGRSRGGGELLFDEVMVGRYRGSPKKEFGGIVDLRRY